MSRLKGWAVAGRDILKTKTAHLANYGRVCSLMMVGPVLLTLAATPLHTAPSIPLPPKKPPMMAGGFIQTAYNPEARSNSLIDVAPYRSSYEGRDMDLYRDIFRLQSAGALKEADALIASLDDRTLMGHVLAQRYLSTSYKVTFAELSSWLSHYADHPQASRVARLAMARAPKSHGAVQPVSYRAAPIEEVEETGMGARHYQPKIQRTAEQNAQAADLIKTVRRLIQQYEPSSALRLFNESNTTFYLDMVEKDRIRALIASGYFYAGKMGEAERLSRAALRSKDGAPMAGWIHGLTKWRAGRYGEAAISFESAASSPYATGWMASGAAYWASRAHEKAGNDRRRVRWLEKSAEYPRTFYGMLATQALGREIPVNWNGPDYARSEEHKILETPAGSRAEKLLAAGEVTLAEAEIQSLYIPGDQVRKKVLLGYAYERRLPALTLKLAHAVQSDKSPPDAALYPSMPWSPNQGYRIDRALLHAIARQESRFTATAENKASGATGLMQLMPRTAGHVAGTNMFMDAAGRSLLKSPEVSLDLGQDYVEELLNNRLVGQDLVALTIAYNAGPGTLARWKSERANITDPLLFIETIPYNETRTYVTRVLANYWLYRLKFDQPNESIEALADGRWARYAAYDKGALKFAAAE